MVNMLLIFFFVMYRRNEIFVCDMFYYFLFLELFLDVSLCNMIVFYKDFMKYLMKCF